MPARIHPLDQELFDLIDEHDARYIYPSAALTLAPIEDELTDGEQRIYELAWGTEEVAA